ncbi:MAG: AI-2E family transporter, partial [Candidatus Thioglobus sp.]|nr:AI-2E family transporter [Candidatus Thioglobus sp.]
MRIPYEHGFMLTLLILAITGLIWLFTPFIPALFLALLIAIATFSQYIKLQKKISNSSSALLMTLLVTVVLILPLSYILLISGLEISALIQNINTNFTVEQSNQLLLQTITGLPLSDSLKVTLNSALSNNLENFIINIKDFSVVILKSIVSLSSHFIFF